MSSDAKPADQFAMTILIALAIGILAALLSGCASAPLKPEPRLPSPAELAALLAAPVPKKRGSKDPIPATFTLRAPHFVLQGHAFAVTCYVPEALGAGAIRFGLEGVHVSDGRISTIQNTLIFERTECGHWLATCAIDTATGKRVLTQDVEVKGGMCEGTR